MHISAKSNKQNFRLKFELKNVHTLHGSEFWRKRNV